MNAMNSTQFDHAHLALDDVLSSVLTFDKKTFELVARAALFIFESSGQCSFEVFIFLSCIMLPYRKESIF